MNEETVQKDVQPVNGAAVVKLCHTMDLVELDVFDTQGDCFTAAGAEAFITRFTMERRPIPVTISVGERRVPHPVGFVRDLRIRKGLISVLEVDLETDEVGDNLIRRGYLASILGVARSVEKLEGDRNRYTDFDIKGVGLTKNKITRTLPKVHENDWLTRKRKF